MPLILNIDTATNQASVSLSSKGIIMQERINRQSMDHAAWIHNAIRDLLDSAACPLTELDAIAIVAGPGSYTGLRVGMATAKGLCYAAAVPLLTLNTLQVMAYASSQQASSKQILCPMLDARRMEVFTALYNARLEEQLVPCAMVLETDSFAAWLDRHEIIFSGNGSQKWKEMLPRHPHAIFKDVCYEPRDIVVLSALAFEQHHFADLAYTDPIYLKAFYSPQKTPG